MRRRCPGLKPAAEALGKNRNGSFGRGAMCKERSVSESRRGLYTRENAGMSSESCARNAAVESPRFPGEGSSTQGKSGPKARTVVVADGQLVQNSSTA